MPLRRTVALLVPLAFTVVLACNGKIDDRVLAATSTGDAGTDAGPAGCVAYAKAQLAYIVRCYPGTQFTAQDEEDFVHECERKLAAPGQRGLEASLEQCASGIAAGSCKDFYFAGCDFPNGTSSDGAPCGEGFQCASGYCRKVDASRNEFPACGTCAPTVAAGARCGPGTLCGRGFYCATAGSEWGTCTASAVGSAGASCDRADPQPCAIGLVCNYGPSGNDFVCGPRARVGARCSDDYVCDEGLVCDREKSTCVPAAREGDPCEDVTCAAGLVCDDATRTCIARIWVAVGEACDRNARTCSDGYCEGAGAHGSGTCAPYLADGDPCDPDNWGCRVGSVCRNGVCTLDDPGACQ